MLISSFILFLYVHLEPCLH